MEQTKKQIKKLEKENKGLESKFKPVSKKMEKFEKLLNEHESNLKKIRKKFGFDKNYGFGEVYLKMRKENDLKKFISEMKKNKNSPLPLEKYKNCAKQIVDYIDGNKKKILIQMKEYYDAHEQYYKHCYNKITGNSNNIRLLQRRLFENQEPNKTIRFYIMKGFWESGDIHFGSLTKYLLKKGCEKKSLPFKMGNEDDVLQKYYISDKKFIGINTFAKTRDDLKQDGEYDFEMFGPSEIFFYEGNNQIQRLITSSLQIKILPTIYEEKIPTNKIVYYTMEYSITHENENDLNGRTYWEFELPDKFDISKISDYRIVAKLMKFKSDWMREDNKDIPMFYIIGMDMIPDKKSKLKPIEGTIKIACDEMDEQRDYYLYKLNNGNWKEGYGSMY